LQLIREHCIVISYATKQINGTLTYLMMFVIGCSGHVSMC